MMDDMFLVFPAFKLSNLGLLIYSYIYIYNYILYTYIHVFMPEHMYTKCTFVNLKKNAWIETRPERPSHSHSFRRTFRFRSPGTGDDKHLQTSVEFVSHWGTTCHLSRISIDPQLILPQKMRAP
jgi:hypothetical protein